MVDRAAADRGSPFNSKYPTHELTKGFVMANGVDLICVNQKTNPGHSIAPQPRVRLLARTRKSTFAEKFPTLSYYSIDEIRQNVLCADDYASGERRQVSAGRNTDARTIACASRRAAATANLFDLNSLS